MVRRVRGKAARNLRVKLEGLNGVKARVGFFEQHRYPDGTPVAQVAAVHEFGAPSKNIPPRPFFRPTIEEYAPAWAKQIEQGAKRVLTGDATAPQVLEAVAMGAAGNVAQTIAAITAPPLAPATVEARTAKRKDKTVTQTLQKPLVDTGLMIQSVTGALVE